MTRAQLRSFKLGVPLPAGRLRDAEQAMRTGLKPKPVGVNNPGDDPSPNFARKPKPSNGLFRGLFRRVFGKLSRRTP